MELILLILGIGALAGLFGGSDDDSDDSTQSTGGAPDAMDPDVIAPGPSGDANETVNITDPRGIGVRTGDGNDVVLGGTGSDSIETNGGADIIFGGGDVDYIHAGSGEDTVVGGSGHDVIRLGGGDDRYAPFDYYTDVPPEFDEPAVSNNWTGGHDTVYGGWGDDFIWDDRGRDTLYGGRGDDVLIPIESPESDQSDDQVFGGLGDDLLNGDNGDQLTGGQDTDHFHIGVIDYEGSNVVVTDFDPSTETVSFHVKDDIPGVDGLQITLAEVAGDTQILMDGVAVVTLQNAVGVDPNSITFSLY